MKVNITTPTHGSTTFTFQPENAAEIELLKLSLPKLSRQSRHYFTHNYGDPFVYLTLQEPSSSD